MGFPYVVCVHGVERIRVFRMRTHEYRSYAPVMLHSRS